MPPPPPPPPPLPPPPRSNAVLTARYIAVLREGDVDALRALALRSGLPADANALPGLAPAREAISELASGDDGRFWRVVVDDNEEEGSAGSSLDSGGYDGGDGRDGTHDDMSGGLDGDSGGGFDLEQGSGSNGSGSNGSGSNGSSGNGAGGGAGGGDGKSACSSPDLAPCSLRGLVWKALLGLGPLDPQEYPRLVQKGPSASDHRVREDARRTFSKNDDFVARVPTAKIIRVINAYVHASGNNPSIYAQSMSLLAAPFLYLMPEPDAFHCFRVFLSAHVPQYVRRYAGARRGCRLLDRCLANVDPSLHALFTRHNLNAEVYAFPSVSSLGACVPPISETVRLWDIQLAFGAHMHILFTLARLVLASDAIRERGLGAPLTTRELEQGLGFGAEAVLARAVPLINQLDPALYNELVDHARIPLTSDHPEPGHKDLVEAASAPHASVFGPVHAPGPESEPTDDSFLLPKGSPPPDCESVSLFAGEGPCFEWPPLLAGRVETGDGRESIRLSKISRSQAAVGSKVSGDGTAEIEQSGGEGH